MTITKSSSTWGPTPLLKTDTIFSTSISARIDLPLSFNLQSSSGTNKPLRTSGLSIRVPNIEREYLIFVTIRPVGQADS
jgi:hypothetical protein